MHYVLIEAVLSGVVIAVAFVGWRGAPAAGLVLTVELYPGLATLGPRLGPRL
jgi:hypothetical protein